MSLQRLQIEPLMAGSIERRRIEVRGIVQGVGFRPFVYRTATVLGLTGWVLNNSAGVVIEAEGPFDQLDALIVVLQENYPPLARIDEIQCAPVAVEYALGFEIRMSRNVPGRKAAITPDSTVCPDCLNELLDGENRRYLYPFINCTNCGPRFTIVTDIPYDRKNTTMRDFAMCPACRTEYSDPLDRRYHAQPNVCPQCGPTVSLISAKQEEAFETEAIAVAARLLTNGHIVAVKGLGGYHLACDALNEKAVALLRKRKRRFAKPFALMVPNLNSARMLCEINEEEARLLESRQRPIVVLKKKDDCSVASEVAPNYKNLGLMLPYTPLHVVLMNQFQEELHTNGLAALVMTSGNLSEEPIAFGDEDARTRLGPLVDAFLTHNREIHTRCDDSVVKVTSGGTQILRRSRGYVPEPIKTEFSFPAPILATGGHLKNTFCLAKDNQAFVSHHIGDLENLETLSSFEEGVAHFKKLFDVKPETVAFDLHPEYLASKYALESGIARQIGVQHHHAHIASVLAEHRLTGAVIGVAADGTGYGTDGAIWGCEILVADLVDFERVAHLHYLPMPGGEQAIRQPWRMAAVYLQRAFGGAFEVQDIPFTRSLPKRKWYVLSQMLDKNVNCPNTSSLGRLFDAVSALLCIRDEVQHEGQAAIELETLAVESESWYPFEIREGEPATLDVSAMIRAIVGDIHSRLPAAQISGKFHRTIAELLAQSCRSARAKVKINKVALSGGVFQNQLLLKQLLDRLHSFDFEVFTNHEVPPNDGGLSLGQAAVAAARLQT